MLRLIGQDYIRLKMGAMNTWLAITSAVSLIAGLITIYMFSRTIVIDHAKHIPDSDVRMLSRQAARWAIASRNDSNPLIANLHANYAAGYLWSLSDVCTVDQFEQAMGMDYQEFKNAIIDVQDAAAIALIGKCQSIAPGNDLLAAIAAEGL